MNITCVSASDSWSWESLVVCRLQCYQQHRHRLLPGSLFVCWCLQRSETHTSLLYHKIWTQIIKSWSWSQRKSQPVSSLTVSAVVSTVLTHAEQLTEVRVWPVGPVVTLSSQLTPLLTPQHVGLIVWSYLIVLNKTSLEHRECKNQWRFLFMSYIVASNTTARTLTPNIGCISK